MTSRGGEQPQDGPDERREPRAKGRRWGRGRGGDDTPPEPAGEEFGWIDDLRTAKQQRTELGPEAVRCRRAPGGPAPRPRGAFPRPGPARRRPVPALPAPARVCHRRPVADPAGGSAGAALSGPRRASAGNGAAGRAAPGSGPDRAAAAGGTGRSADGSRPARTAVSGAGGAGRSASGPRTARAAVPRARIGRGHRLRRRVAPGRRRSPPRRRLRADLTRRTPGPPAAPARRCRR